MIYVPKPYQDYTYNRIIEQPAVGVFLDMGMGKTAATETAIVDLLYDYFLVDRVLVIATKRVASMTWDEEAEKWDHTRRLKLSKVLGTKRQREKALQTEADIYTINRENVEWLVNYYGRDWPFDMVVIDESSGFRSPKSGRFRAIRKVRPLIKRIVELTGTPNPKSYLNLWSQIYLLDRGERLGKTYTGYRERYFEPDKRNAVTIFSWKLKEGAAEAIQAKIADIVFSMNAADWLDLPEFIPNAIKVRLSDEARAKYKQLERDLLLPYTELLDRHLVEGGGDVVANTAAALSNKLIQMANGAVYDENQQTRVIHDAKLDALEELIEEQDGDPVLVGYWYKHDRNRILQRFPQARELKEDQDIRDWNAGKIPILLAHPASCGHGLNLQFGGSTVVWFSLTWDLELYQQLNRRLDRQGQTRSGIIHHIVAEGTIDERVMLSLDGKDAEQAGLLTAVKAMIQEIKEAYR